MYPPFENSTTRITIAGTIAWAIVEYWGFEATLFVDMKLRKSKSKSILTKFICFHLLSFMLKNKIASKQGYNSLEKMLKQSYFEKSDSFVETQSAMACT